MTYPAQFKQSNSGSKNFLVRRIQAEIYPTEIKLLSEGKQVQKDSDLINLAPRLDEKGLIRVGGRSQNSELPTKEGNPILLPGNSHLRY